MSYEWSRPFVEEHAVAYLECLDCRRSKNWVWLLHTVSVLGPKVLFRNVAILLDWTHPFPHIVWVISAICGRISTCLFGMLGLSTIEELSVTFAYGVRFGPISTFQKCSDPFGLNPPFSLRRTRDFGHFLKNKHLLIWKAWIVDDRRTECNFCIRCPFWAHKYFSEM